MARSGSARIPGVEALVGIIVSLVSLGVAFQSCAQSRDAQNAAKLTSASVTLRIEKVDSDYQPGSRKQTYLVAATFTNQGPGVAKSVEFGVWRPGHERLRANRSGDPIGVRDALTGNVTVPADYLDGLPSDDPKKFLAWFFVYTDELNRKTEKIWDPKIWPLPGEPR